MTNRRPCLVRFSAACALVMMSCEGAVYELEAPRPSSDLAPAAGAPPSRLPGVARLVAMGDVHGDLGAFRAALRLAGAIDLQDAWIGGKLVVVQTGDHLDRGDEELEIIELWTRLEGEAREAGGALIMLNGNHELMNAARDFRYVTPRGFEVFRELERVASESTELVSSEPPEAARGRAYQPGGPFALGLATHNTAQIVGDTVFVHGGLLPQHAERGLEAINASIQAWLRGELSERPAEAGGGDTPIWSRHYSDDADDEDCELLKETLERLGVGRMVVGHTVQESGINPACDRGVWRIDVGMARAYGGPIEVLEIEGGVVRVLRLADEPAAAAH